MHGANYLKDVQRVHHGLEHKRSEFEESVRVVKELADYDARVRVVKELADYDAHLKSNSK